MLGEDIETAFHLIVPRDLGQILEGNAKANDGHELDGYLVSEASAGAILGDKGLNLKIWERQSLPTHRPWEGPQCKSEPPRTQTDRELRCSCVFPGLNHVSGVSRCLNEESLDPLTRAET